MPNLFYQTSFIGLSVFVLLLAPAKLKAQENAQGEGSPYEENRIDALHFRAPERAMQINAELGLPIENSEQRTQDGVGIRRINRSGTPLDVTYVYGITDTLLVSISESDLLNGSADSTNQITGYSNSTSFSGLSDPTLHLSYRFFGELKGRNFASLSFDYSPSMGNNRAATNSTDGNNLRGGVYEQIAATYFHVEGNHEFELAANLQSYSRQNTITDNAADSSSTAAYSRSYLYGSYRFHFLDKEFFELYANFDNAYNMLYSNPNQNPIYTSTLHHDPRVLPGLRWGRQITTQSLLMLEYSYSTFTTETQPTSGGGNTDPITNQFVEQSLVAQYSIVF